MTAAAVSIGAILIEIARIPRPNGGRLIVSHAAVIRKRANRAAGATDNLAA